MCRVENFLSILSQNVHEKGTLYRNFCQNLHLSGKKQTQFLYKCIRYPIFLPKSAFLETETVSLSRFPRILGHINEPLPQLLCLNLIGPEIFLSNPYPVPEFLCRSEPLNTTDTCKL